MSQLTLLALIVFPCFINYLAEKLPGLVKREGAALGALGFAVLTGLTFVSGAPIRVSLGAFSDSLAMGLSFDVLSGLISATVLLIGAFVMKFSVRYLEDDPCRKDFHQSLAILLTFVLLMLNAANLLLYWLAWAGASFFLHKLLIHFQDRKGAQLAAHQKFWISRLGDLFIVLAALFIYRIFGSLDFEFIVAQSADKMQLPENLYVGSLAAVLLVVGAMTKSAQFPFHFWLPNTMETPTPVSAIMHAGIINAGGYLVIRMGGFLDKVPLSLNLLAVVGGFTAVYGSVVMLSQTSVKKNLAYSTISQMGFMMLQCGLGAFSIAVVHIIGHAFYKAYLFLSAGTATDFAKLNRYLPKKQEDPKIWTPFVVGFACISGALLLGPFVGYPIEKPGALVLLVVLGLAVAQIFLSYRTVTEAIRVSTLLVVTYFVLFHLVDRLLVETLMTTSLASGEPFLGLQILLSSLFVGLFIGQNNMERISRTSIGKKIYVHSLNGGFFGYEAK